MTDLQKKLTERIVSEYCLSQRNAQAKALELCNKCPNALQKNLEQWAMGHQLEEVFIGHYSLPMILAIWGNRDFIGALDVLTDYLLGNKDAAERRIWQMRR